MADWLATTTTGNGVQKDDGSAIGSKNDLSEIVEFYSQDKDGLTLLKGSWMQKVNMSFYHGFKPVKRS